jgi:Ras family protein T1
MKLGDSSNVYNKIVSAAEHPHLSIPETEIGKKRKQYNRLVQNSLIFASGVSLNFSYQNLIHDAYTAN